MEAPTTNTSSPSSSTCQVILFGDQVVPYHDELLRLLARPDHDDNDDDNNNRLLATLLADTHRALRAELARLRPSQAARFPPSSTLHELLAAHRASSLSASAAEASAADASATPRCCYRSGPLDSALACLHQLASFVSYV